MPDRLKDSATPAAVPYAYPLDEFYARSGIALPEIERVAPEELPEPQRSLLVHQKDMTPTLEEFHAATIHLEIIGREHRDNFYFREVVLRLDGTNVPVEFGANRISLSLFPPKARPVILEEHLPLGRILKDFHVGHTTTARAFFRVRSDELMARALKLTEVTILYGRKATILDPQQRPLSEIVEILPPFVKHET